MKTKRVVLAGILSVAALVGVVAASAAHGVEQDHAPAGTDSSDAWEALEEELQQAPEWEASPESERMGLLRTAAGSSVWTVAQEFSGYVDGGYLSSDSNVLELIWDGVMSEEELAAINEANIYDLEIRVAEAAHSDAEIRQAIKSVDAALRDSGIDVDEITSDRQRRSVIVTLLVIKGEESKVDQRDLAQGLAEAAAGDVPVIVSVGEPIDLSQIEPDADGFRSSTFDTRWADTGQLDAGNGVISSDGSFCTTGLSFS